MNKELRIEIEKRMANSTSFCTKLQELKKAFCESNTGCPITNPREDNTCYNCSGCYFQDYQNELDYNETCMELFTAQEWVGFHLTAIKKFCLNAYRLDINPLPSIRNLDWIKFYNITVDFNVRSDYQKKHTNHLFINPKFKWETLSQDEQDRYEGDDAKEILGLSVNFQA